MYVLVCFTSSVLAMSATTHHWAMNNLNNTESSNILPIHYSQRNVLYSNSIFRKWQNKQTNYSYLLNKHVYVMSQLTCTFVCKDIHSQIMNTKPTNISNILKVIKNPDNCHKLVILVMSNYLSILNLEISSFCHTCITLQWP